MEVDFEEFDEFGNAPSPPKQVPLCFKVIGEPLVCLTPFSFSLDAGYEELHEYCKGCLTKLNSSQNFYCTKDCKVRDKKLAAIENEIDFNDKSFKEQFGDFMTDNLFLTLNKLCIRTLYCAKDKQRKSAGRTDRYDESFLPEAVSYDEIDFRLDIDELGPIKHPIEFMQDYSADYDEYTEEQRQQFDEKLGLSIPSDETISDMYRRAQAEKTLESMIDHVQEDLEPNRDSQPRLLSFGEDSDHSMQQDSHICIDISSQVNTAITKKGDTSQTERYEEIMNDYRQQNPGFEMAQFEGGNISDVDAIANYKREFRICTMDVMMFAAENTDKQRSKVDRLCGDWVRELRQFITTNEVAKEFLGHCSWDDILKAFSMTIRYSVGIQDFLGSNTIALALYLPLVNVKHSCRPNCSFVFENQQMNIFYKPEKEIVVKQDENCYTSRYSSEDEIIRHSSPLPLKEYLPLEDRSKTFAISINFQLEPLFGNEKRYHDQLASFRGLECTCGACFGMDSSDDKSDCSGDMLNMFDNNYMSCDSQAFYQDEEEDEAMPPQKEESEESAAHESTFEAIKLLFVAGKRDDPQFSSDIQSLLDQMIICSRQALGFYNPKITGFLFYYLCSKFQLIYYETNDVLRFYKFRSIDSFLCHVLESIIVTHGKRHSAVSTLETIHKLCHHHLEESFEAVRDKLVNIEPAIHRELPNSTMAFENCAKLQQIKLFSCTVNWELGILCDEKEEKIELEEDGDESPGVVLDTSYDSFEVPHGRKRKLEETDEAEPVKTTTVNDMTTLMKHLRSIFDISTQHYL